MKLRVVIFCGVILVANVAFASGPYEIGHMTIDGNTCRWTSDEKQDCTREEMHQKVEEMNECLGPRLESETENCEDEACVRETIRAIATDCCQETDGEMV